MSAQEIASILGNAKKVGNGYLASCPVPHHGQGNGDKHPSLSITESDDGNYLFKCHGGCDQHTVFSTIKDMGILPQLPDRTEYLSSIKPIPTSSQATTPTAMTLEHEWHYVDEDGISLFLKQRYKTNDAKGKTYKTLRVMPDGSRVGKLGDCRIIPYRLPELRQAIADGRVIYITEGEKAADSLCSLGVVATTSHAGAGGWNQDLNQYFAGANVVIVPDNDAAGWGYAHKIVESLLASGSTKSIRVLDLPLTHPKEDAYEWVNRYDGSRSLLAQLAKACPIVSSVEQVWPPLRLHEYVPEPQPKESSAAVKEAKPSRLLVESWDSIKDEPVEWLVQSIIPKKAFVALYAPPASYKSFISLDLAEAIATGREWMGYKIPKKGAVLYICGEGHGGMGARVKACKIQNQSPDGANLYIIRAQLNLRSSPEDFIELLNAINDLIAEIGEPIELIILDTLMRMSGGGFNENSSEDMGAFITQAGKLQELFECALMVIHHSGKDVTKGLRGHSSLLGAVDTELEIQRQDSVINSADSSVIGNAILTVSKQKDGADSIQIGIEIVLVEIGTSDLGFEITTSLAIRHNPDIASSTSKGSKNNQGSGNNQRLEMDSLMKVIKSKGTYSEVDGSSRYGVSLDDWRAEFWSMKGCTEDDRVSFRKAWVRARERLVAINKITIASNWVWLKTTSESY
jgi:hypothetical protein